MGRKKPGGKKRQKKKWKKEKQKWGGGGGVRFGQPGGGPSKGEMTIPKRKWSLNLGRGPLVKN